jgi:RNA polymerase sigma-70 factor, ECF subfamily
MGGIMSYDQRQRIFRVFYNRYFKRIRSRVMQILDNERDAADDIAQEAFMRAYMYLDKIYKRKEFLKWIYTVSRNLSFNYRRSKRYNASKSLNINLSVDGYDHELIDILADDSYSEPDKAAEKNELLNILSNALNSLSPNYRSALQLCGLDGMTYADAAITLNTSVSSIAHNFMRAKRELSCLIAC